MKNHALWKCCSCMIIMIIIIIINIINIIVYDSSSLDWSSHCVDIAIILFWILWQCCILYQCCDLHLNTFSKSMGRTHLNFIRQIWNQSSKSTNGCQCFDFVCPKAQSVHPNWCTRSNLMRPESRSVRPGRNDALWIQRCYRMPRSYKSWTYVWHFHGILHCT